LANSSATELISDFISLFFPRCCVGCREALVKGEELICTQCMLEMPKTDYHLEVENPFYQKFRGRIPVRFVMALFKFVKASRVQEILHALKYNNKPELGRMLGQLYGHELAKHYSTEFDLIIPVPLHKARKRVRGYNQSAEFGSGLAEVLGVPCMDDLMARVKKTTTQTRKSRLNRWENVDSVFEVQDLKMLAKKRILLVDDVITTGATLEACGRSILDAGCKELSIACIAATQ
jgi:ComF family protein